MKPADDVVSEHTSKVIRLDRKTGEIVWEATAHKGVPDVARKRSKPDSTPATDGKCVVVVFGSIGLVAAYDIATGKQLWKWNVGANDTGWFLEPA